MLCGRLSFFNLCTFECNKTFDLLTKEYMYIYCIISWATLQKLNGLKFTIKKLKMPITA